MLFHVFCLFYSSFDCTSLSVWWVWKQFQPAYAGWCLLKATQQLTAKCRLVPASFEAFRNQNTLGCIFAHTVDGSEIRRENQLRLGESTINYKVSGYLRWCRIFEPSTVVLNFNWFWWLSCWSSPVNRMVKTTQSLLLGLLFSSCFLFLGEEIACCTFPSRERQDDLIGKSFLFNCGVMAFHKAHSRVLQPSYVTDSFWQHESSLG